MSITKGIWEARKPLDMEAMRHIFVHNGKHNICRVDGHIDGLCCKQPAIGMEEAKENAILIAEAGTVKNETGYTPRQLAEQKKALLDALRNCVIDAKQRLTRGERLGRIKEAVAAIAGATN